MSTQNPKREDDIPWCDESCEAYDGRRCGILGHEPTTICQLVVKDMTRERAAAHGIIRRGAQLEAQEAARLIGDMLDEDDDSSPSIADHLSPQSLRLLAELSERGYYGQTPDEVGARFIDAWLQNLSPPPCLDYQAMAREIVEVPLDAQPRPTCDTCAHDGTYQMCVTRESAEIGVWYFPYHSEIQDVREESP